MRRAAAALAWIALLAGCGGSTVHSPEYRLAATDGASPDGEDDAALEPYRAAFVRLERICTDSRAAIADRAVLARDALRAMNIPDSTLAFLQEAASSAEGRHSERRRGCRADFDAAATLLELTGK
jgi:hypothetical protein